MAKIQLSEFKGFNIIPEGTHVFLIEDVKYDPDFGKIEIQMVTVKNEVHKEVYRLIRDNGEVNEGAINAFSYFARTALNDFSLDEIDHEDLIGCYITAEVVHNKQEGKGKHEGKTLTFVNLGQLSPASGFPDADVEETAPAPNLDDLLG